MVEEAPRFFQRVHLLPLSVVRDELGGAAPVLLTDTSWRGGGGEGRGGEGRGGEGRGGEGGRRYSTTKIATMFEFRCLWV